MSIGAEPPVGKSSSQYQSPIKTTPNKAIQKEAKHKSLGPLEPKSSRRQEQVPLANSQSGFKDGYNLNNKNERANNSFYVS